MKQERLSVRQLSLAAVAGGLTPAVSAVQYGWQGAALAVPVLILAGGVMIRLSCRWTALAQSAAGTVLRVCYTLWGTLLFSRWLGRCALRIERTGGAEEGTAKWILLLLALFLFWLVRGKTARFFRMAELCSMAVLLTAAVVFAWSLMQVDWAYVSMSSGNVAEGFLTSLEAGGTFLFVLPYINKVKTRTGDGMRAMRGLLILSAVPALLSAVTVGVLSPAVTALATEPFFTMTAALGTTFRVEGLVSSLWLLADLIYLGLLAQCGMWKKTGRMLVVLLGSVIAGIGFFADASVLFWVGGSALLWGGAVLLLCVTKENSGCSEVGGTTSCGQKEDDKKDQKK